MDEQNESAGDQAEESKGPAQVEVPLESKSEENRLSFQKSVALAEPEYPGPAQVALIMTCILCAIFIMSLVSFCSRLVDGEATLPSLSIPIQPPPPLTLCNNKGPHDHLNRNPPDH